MQLWKQYNKHAAELMGLIPDFVSSDDPRPAQEQINENYAHGGGWHPLKGWVYDKDKNTIKYPGDPAKRPLAETMIRDQRVIVYTDAWVAVVNADGSYEVARID